MAGLFNTMVIISIGTLYLSCKESPNDTLPAPKTVSTSAAKETAAVINLDKSPLDISYYPVDYPKLDISGNLKEPLLSRVIYSRPKKEGRVIFGNVLKYGSRWRLGANEATEIEFFKDVTIQNIPVKKSRYIIYCIPYENSWTVVLNNGLFTWGLKIDSTKDVYRFEVPVQRTDYPIEYYTMEFQKSDTGINLVMAWDTVRTILPILY